MRRCPARDDLERYLTQQLAPADHAILADHLDTCPACRITYDQLTNGPEPTLVLHPAPGTVHDTTTDNVPWAEAPTVRLWGLDLAPRPGERLVQTPGFDWTFPAAAVHPVPAIRGYEVLGELGRGGMGIVYKARQAQLNRIVALKMILSTDLTDPETLVRFRTEAEAVAQLQHPNIVHVYEVGTTLGRPFYSLEYVGGGTLAQSIAAGVPPPSAAAALVETLARAIHYAHERGVVHRDLKPANILLVRDPASRERERPESSLAQEKTPVAHAPGSPAVIPKITDFGLAKYTSAAAPQRPGSPTRPGLVIGTPQYMAPEQADATGRSIGPAVDVYSLGAILYELLTGRPPFQGATAMDTLLRARILDPIAPHIWQPKVPRDLETITLKCLRKEPPQRYASAAALADDLRRWLDGKPITARPAGMSERVWKWVRRHPLVTALGLATVLATLSGAAGMTWQWGQTEIARHEAVLAHEREVERRDRAESDLYLSRIALAHLHFQANHVDRAIAALDLCRPTADQPDRRQWEWHYLYRLCHAQLADYQLLRQEIGFAAAGVRPNSQLAAEGVTAAALSPDGKWLATVRWGKENPVGIHDAASGTRTATLTGLSQPFLVAFSPNGQRLAIVGATGALQLWDVATWQEVLSLPAPAVLASTPDSMRARLTFSTDGTIIGARLMDGDVALWDGRPLDDG